MSENQLKNSVTLTNLEYLTSFCLLFSYTRLVEKVIYEYNIEVNKGQTMVIIQQELNITERQDDTAQEGRDRTQLPSELIDALQKVTGVLDSANAEIFDLVVPPSPNRQKN